MAKLFSLFAIALVALNFHPVALESNLDEDRIMARPKCPFSGFYSEEMATWHSFSSDKPGCPLKSKCPYYAQHENDSSLGEYWTDASHECPLAKKCTFYQAMKKGEHIEINFENENCPLAGKCPYYASMKEAPEKLTDCPVMHACPKYKKEHISGQNHAKMMSGKSLDCPFLKQQKERKNNDNGKMNTGCPYMEKCPHYNSRDIDTVKCPLENCPYFEKIKKGETFSAEEMDRKLCPISEKCPYYKEFKEGNVKDCPFQGNMPHASLNSESKSGCPFKNSIEEKINDVIEEL